ncbi:MAG: translocation/assembly module TamB domain-containing protein, partial [Pseudomonadota bacterium]
LTRTLQDLLSGAGRSVSIDGFAGALTAQASFERMTVSDDEGVWLTLEDVTLDWNRSALLRGRLEVQELTAARLDVPRLPVPDNSAVPEAEAAAFRLPDLPVSVELTTFAIGEINLGAPLFGEAAQLRLQASARLTDNLADVELTAARTDEKRGSFDIKANLDRRDQVLDLLVDLSEGREGVAARLLGLPDRPAIDLSIAGAGPLDDFTADIGLNTDGQERLSGEVTLAAQAPRRASARPDRRVQADIGGDITALLAPRYRAFFGDDIALRLDALIEGSGAIDFSDVSLRTQAANLQGQLRLNADNWPVFIDIDGQIANPDGTATLLPLGGAATTVQSVRLAVDYDAQNGDAVAAGFDVTGLQTAAADIAQARLVLDGTLQSAAGRQGAFDGEVQLTAAGLAMTDPALAQAVGSQIVGAASVSYAEGQPVELRDLRLSGADYGLTGGAVIEALETGLRTTLDAQLRAQNINRFSGLAGREITGATALALSGTVVPLSGQFDVKASGTADDIRLGIAQADAVLAGRTALILTARRNETGTRLRDVRLKNDALDFTGEADLKTETGTVEATFSLADVGLVVPQYTGPVVVVGRAEQRGGNWRIDAATEGPYGVALTARGLATGPDALLRFTADVPEINRFTPTLEGPVQARGTLGQTPDGWRVEARASGPLGTAATLDGLIAPRIALTFDARAAELGQLVPQVTGPVAAKGTLEQRGTAYFVTSTATGPYESAAKIDGQIAPSVALEFALTADALDRLVPQLRGSVSAEGLLEQRGAAFFVRTQAAGPFGARADVEGIATGPDMRLDFDASIPNVQPLAPGVSGPLSARGVLRQTAQGITVDTTASGPFALRAAVQGLVTGPSANVSFEASLPNMGVIVDQINGPLSVTGRAAKQGNDWQIDTDADGPAGTQANVAGRVGNGGRLDLDITGRAPLGLSSPFLAPRDLQGQAEFDLRVNGPAQLSSVTGTIVTAGARFSAPNLRIALQDIGGIVRLGGNRAQVDLTAAGSNGGEVRAAGAITLTPALPADVQIGLGNLVVIDPRLYRTLVNGALRVAGPLRGGAAISGQVDVGETTVNVPSTGLTSIGDIPAINHIGATRPVMSTRRKAGVDEQAAGEAEAGSAGATFGLNIAVNAPNRIFVRGRGLDAELGGALRLTGTTRRVISAGRFDLLRGRLDILGKRFDLREGAVQFQGDLVPYIRFVTATSTSTGEVRVVVDGPVDAPEVTFEATPDAPQDEVLAQLLFGRNISQISPLQALQLANAVATLAGRGGVSVIANLRQGFGLDDLDVTTNDDGTTAVRAGKYISENVYTDVTAASDGTGEISLNLDITPNLTGKATVGSDGNSGVGIFFEKDY